MSRIVRLSIIFYTAWRFNLFGLIRDNLRPGVRRFFLGLIASTSPSQLPRGERIRLALEALGPIFVKFGQVLSTAGIYCPMTFLMNLQSCKIVSHLFPMNNPKQLLKKHWDIQLKWFFHRLMQHQWQVHRSHRFILESCGAMRRIPSG